MFWERKRVLRTRKKREENNKVLLQKCGATVLFVAIVIGGIAYITHRPEINIQSVTYTGLSTLSEIEIRDSVERHLEGSYAFIFSKKNIALYPDDTIEAYALDTHKKIKDITLKRQSLTSLSIEIIERAPHALWCGDTKEEQFEKCYFLDNEGLIYTDAPMFTGNVFFIYYGYLDAEEPIGSQYISTEKFEQIQLFIELFESTSLTPVALYVKNENDAELYLEKGGTILFRHDGDFARMFENLETVLETEQFKDETLELDQIDLRFGNKVYYKVE